MDGVIRNYSNRKPDERLFETELEYVMLKWLTILSIKPQEATEEPEKTLAASGFISAIRDAMVLI